MLDQLNRAVVPAHPEPFRRSRESLPEPVAGFFEEQDLAARPLDPDPRRKHPGVVDNGELVRVELVGQLREAPVANLSCCALVDEQPRVIALVKGALRDQLGG